MVSIFDFFPVAIESDQWPLIVVIESDLYILNSLLCATHVREPTFSSVSDVPV
jgi:hypothetical protein